MFGIPLPYLLIAVTIALFGSYRGGYHFGWSDRDAEMQIAIAKKNEEARALERNMTSKLADQETQLRKAQDDIVKKQSAMHELARTGRMRLPTASCPQASANATPATGNIPDATDIERQTIEALIDIAAEGDKAITKLNSCITAYNEVRNLVNGQ
jgi:mannitol/fructose-specific phosphotransferase system IIA component